MKQKNNKRKIIIIIAELLLIVFAAGLAMRIHLNSGGITDTASDNEAVSTEVAETDEAAETADADEPLATIFFASDYQAESGWDAPAKTLTGILGAAAEDGKAIDGAILCGDYSNDRKLHDYQISPDSAIEEIRQIVSSECGVSQDEMIFVQGNHDALTESISDSGLHKFDDYLVYVLNTQEDFPWKQGKTAGCLSKVRTAAEDMRSCFTDLIESGERRPVIIAGHVPLHFTARTSSRHTTGDNLYSSLIFDVVNEAAESLDIIYLYGHNHSKGWDCYMGGASVYKEAGSSVLIPEFNESSVNTDRYTEERLNFTYLNAGYVGYYMNCGAEELENGTSGNYSAADETLTGTVCEVLPEEIVLTRYSAEGVHPMGCAGEADPYKGNIDEGLIDSSCYSEQTESPVHVKRLHYNNTRKPLIAVVDYDTRDAERVINRIKQGGYKAERVGTLDELDMDKYDAVVIPGGNSVTPSMYGAERDPSTTDTDIEKDKFQFEAVRRYVDAGKPVLGICRGEQLVNNVLGGTTIQDIPEGWHKKDRTVRIAEGSLLYDLLGEEAVTYHYHHQAVDQLGEGLYATEWDSETGTIEAYEHKTLPVYGIQWHPDSMDKTGAKVFAEFCKVVEQNMKQS